MEGAVATAVRAETGRTEKQAPMGSLTAESREETAGTADLADVADAAVTPAEGETAEMSYSSRGRRGLIRFGSSPLDLKERSRVLRELLVNPRPADGGGRAALALAFVVGALPELTVTVCAWKPLALAVRQRVARLAGSAS